MRKNIQERRRFLRFPIMGMVQIKEFPSGKSEEGYLANISRDGIGLYVHRRMRLGQTYCVRPMSPNYRDELWVVKAIWCNPVCDRFTAGFKFTLMTDKDFERIKGRFLLFF